MKKAYKGKCPEFEDFLIRQTVERLDEEQTGKLKQHLENCTGCQRFQSVLANMLKSMKIEEKTAFGPHPHIRQTVLQKMKQSQRKQATFLSESVQAIGKLLQYRIPLYQGILGILLLALLIWGTNNLPFLRQPPFQQNLYPEQEENIQVNQTNVLNSLDILEPQKIGKAVSEDTMLAKFFSPAM